VLDRVLNSSVASIHQIILSVSEIDNRVKKIGRFKRELARLVNRNDKTPKSASESSVWFHFFRLQPGVWPYRTVGNKKLQSVTSN